MSDPSAPLGRGGGPDLQSELREAMSSQKQERSNSEGIRRSVNRDMRLSQMQRKAFATKIDSALQKFEQSFTKTGDSLAEKTSGALLQSVTGPFGKLFEDLTGYNISAKIGEKVGSLLAKPTEAIRGLLTKQKPDKRLKDSAESLSAEETTAEQTTKTNQILEKQYGLASEEAQARKLDIKDIDQKEGKEPKSLMDRIFGKEGLFSKLLSPAGLLRAAGGAAFIGLLVHDFLNFGLKKFQKGDYFGGIIDTLFGKEAKTDKDVGLNMLKQAGKYGGLGMAVGGPIGAAIGAGIGLTVAGIKGAIELEWDKKATEIAENVRDTLADPNKGFGEKFVTAAVGLGKGVFGALAGGVRDVGEGWQKSFAKVQGVWKDESRSVVEKVGVTLFEFIKEDILMPKRFLVGAAKTAGKFIWGLVPERFQQALVGPDGKGGLLAKIAPVPGKVAQFFSQIPAIKKITEVGKIFWNSISNGVSSFFMSIQEGGFVKGVSDKTQGLIDSAKAFGEQISSGVQSFFDDVRTKGLGAAVTSRLGEVIQTAGTFAQGVVNDIGSWLDRIKKEGILAKLNEKIGVLVDKAREFGEGIVSGVQEFFSEVKEKGFFQTAGSRIVGAGRGFFSGLLGNKVEEKNSEATSQQIVELLKNSRGVSEEDLRARVMEIMAAERAASAAGKSVAGDTTNNSSQNNTNAVINVAGQNSSQRFR